MDNVGSFTGLSHLPPWLNLRHRQTRSKSVLSVVLIQTGIGPCHATLFRTKIQGHELQYEKIVKNTATRLCKAFPIPSNGRRHGTFFSFQQNLIYSCTVLRIRIRSDPNLLVRSDHKKSQNKKNLDNVKVQQLSNNLSRVGLNSRPSDLEKSILTS